MCTFILQWPFLVSKMTNTFFCIVQKVLTTGMITTTSDQLSEYSRSVSSSVCFYISMISCMWSYSNTMVDLLSGISAQQSSSVVPLIQVAVARILIKSKDYRNSLYPPIRRQLPFLVGLLVSSVKDFFATFVEQYYDSIPCAMRIVPGYFVFIHFEPDFFYKKCLDYYVSLSIQ